jgi:hypothetical protein
MMGSDFFVVLVFYGSLAGGLTVWRTLLAWFWAIVVIFFLETSIVVYYIDVLDPLSDGYVFIGFCSIGL